MGLVGLGLGHVHVGFWDGFGGMVGFVGLGRFFVRFGGFGPDVS